MLKRQEIETEREGQGNGGLCNSGIRGYDVTAVSILQQRLRMVGNDLCYRLSKNDRIEGDYGDSNEIQPPKPPMRPLSITVTGENEISTIHSRRNVCRS